MEFFKKFFKDYQEYDTGELAVKCPFPHKDEKGNTYFESVPSAHINQEDSLFHCKVCGAGLSEANFLSKVQGISYKDALILLAEMQNHPSDEWSPCRDNFLSLPEGQETWKGLGFSLETAEALQIGYEGKGISFPVYIYGELLDVRNYVQGRKPKVLSRGGSTLPKGKKSLLLPFDLWREDDRPTLLCAGEKDMAAAREHSFNGLTFTGGENSFPKLFKASFKGKKFYILYDNDQAGHDGSRKIASLLRDAGAIPYVVTGHYSVCVEKGGDLHDFFYKYGRTSQDLQKILDETPEFTEEEHRVEQQSYIPLVTIEESTKGMYTNRLVSSRVSVVATWEEAYQVPDYAELTKIDIDKKATMMIGEQKTYSLDEENIKDILSLMDSNLKEEQISSNLKLFAGIPPKETHIRTVVKSRVNVFKAVVMDDLESGPTKNDGTEEKTSMREMLVYSVGEPLRASMKYRIFYKPNPHPLKGQQIVAIVTKIEESDNSVNRFKVDANVIDSLKCFQVGPNETVAIKMQELYERSKGIIGVEARKDVTFATDLFFHTPLEFKFAKRLERGYLDVMIVGDERTGKSQAAKKLMELYELGLITSLKTATVPGLLGGSDRTDGGWKTKLGLIPRTHKGALVLEEFSGGGQQLISQLTEVRSSNRVRLTRVNGTVDVPAMVRMLSISNPQTQDGISLPLRNYPHGIKVLLDLIGAGADIARYDFFVLVDDVEQYTSPLEEFDLEPYEKHSYQNRIRWIWSRKADQIHIERPVLEAIVKAAEELNKAYNTHIKLFGPEAWKKVARIAIATAALVCSMSDDGENLIVTEDHVRWAQGFLIACYDNQIFKLREYVERQRKLVECDDAAVHALQGLFTSHQVLLTQLEMSTDISQRDLQMMSNMDGKEFSKVMNAMVKFGFVEYGAKILPTQRFRTAMTRIDKVPFMKRIGE